MQIPVDAPTGTVPLTVSVGGVTSAPFNITLDTYAPVLFGGINVATGIYNGPEYPAKPGGTVTMGATGLGPTTPPTATGPAVKANPTLSSLRLRWAAWLRTSSTRALTQAARDITRSSAPYPRACKAISPWSSASGDLVPKPLIVARSFAVEQQAITKLEGELESIAAQMAEMEEEHGGDEGAFADLDKVNKANLTSRLKELKGIGIAVGLAVALGLTCFVQSQLLGIQSTDPITMAIATVALAMFACLAGNAPALRASRVDPIRALRYELAHQRYFPTRSRALNTTCISSFRAFASRQLTRPSESSDTIPGTLIPVSIQPAGSVT